MADLSRAQHRIESTITALQGQLASRRVARDEDREPVMSKELLDRVARENMRSSGRIVDQVHADEAGIVFGWSGGLRFSSEITWSATPSPTAGRVVSC